MKYGPQTITTVHGYVLAEVASALQKAIRRGEEEAALYWAAEMDRSGYGKYCWKRLRIICSEDIGLANPSLPATIHALHETWKDHRKERDAKNQDRVFLFNAVLLMVRSPKSRIVDHAQAWFYNDFEPHREMPDEALDIHTRRGKQMGRDINFFLDVGMKLNNVELDDPYEERFRLLCRGEHGPVVNPPVDAHNNGRQTSLFEKKDD